MKRAFTSFSPSLRRIAKTHSTSPGHVHDLMCMLVCGVTSGTITQDEAGLFPDGWYADCVNDIKGWSVAIAAAWIDLDVLSGKCLHLFLPDRAFCDWVVDCVPTLEPEHAILLQNTLGHKPGVLHFPSNSRLISCAFFVCPQDRDSVLVRAGVSLNLKRGQLILSPSVESQLPYTNINLWQDSREAHRPDIIYYAKLIIGLGMYADCFPEMIKEGPPSDLKHPSQHNYSHSQTIHISDKVRGSGTHASPNAHFRCGHFRVLRSEKFTNKRFQAVFVRETFVAGKAKTVLPI